MCGWIIPQSLPSSAPCWLIRTQPEGFVCSSGAEIEQIFFFLVCSDGLLRSRFFSAMKNGSSVLWMTPCRKKIILLPYESKKNPNKLINHALCVCFSLVFKTYDWGEHGSPARKAGGWKHRTPGSVCAPELHRWLFYSTHLVTAHLYWEQTAQEEKLFKLLAPV